MNLNVVDPTVYQDAHGAIASPNFGKCSTVHCWMLMSRTNQGWMFFHTAPGGSSAVGPMYET